MSSNTYDYNESNYIYLFIFMIILVSVVIYFSSYTRVRYEVGKGTTQKVLDLNIPVHVISSSPVPVTFKVPDGRFDGDSIVLVLDIVNPTTVQNNIILNCSNVRTGTTKGTALVEPFVPGRDGSQDISSIFRMIWWNGAWNIDNNNYNL